MALEAIKFISTLVRWIDDDYEPLLVGGNVKEDIWWITTWVIRSTLEYYLSQERSTAAKTSFGSYSQHRSTLIWGVIKGHLAVDNMLEKYIKDNHIIVGSRRKESWDICIRAR